VEVTLSATKQTWQEASSPTSSGDSQETLHVSVLSHVLGANMKQAPRVTFATEP